MAECVTHPLYYPDKREKSVGMNIKLRLAGEEEELEGAAAGPTLEFVFEKEGVFLKEEETVGPGPESDRTEPCSAGSSQTTNSDRGPDTTP